LPNSVVDACTVNAFKARLDKFWQHQSVKFDFTADLTGTENRSEEVINLRPSTGQARLRRLGRL